VTVLFSDGAAVTADNEMDVSDADISDRDDNDETATLPPPRLKFLDVHALARLLHYTDDFLPPPPPHPMATVMIVLQHTVC